MSQGPKAYGARDVVLSAVLMILIAAAGVWVDPLLGGVARRPRSAGEWAASIARVVVFYGAMMWAMSVPRRVLHRDRPHSLVPASKRVHRDQPSNDR